MQEKPKKWDAQEKEFFYDEVRKDAAYAHTQVAYEIPTLHACALATEIEGMARTRRIETGRLKELLRDEVRECL